MAIPSNKAKAVKSKTPPKAARHVAGRTKKAAAAFSPLEKNILQSKGITAAQLMQMQKCGIRSCEDFRKVGDAATLAGLVKVSRETAEKVMSWALGTTLPSRKNFVVESADAMYCLHCQTKQPKDYKSGDLCVSCGKQAEPVMACYWCGATGPGKYCRQCGAEFVPTGELELALLLKREGLPKNDIPEKLRGMSAGEKDVLWGRARKY